MIGNMRDEQEETVGCRVEIQMPKSYNVKIERKSTNNH